MSDQTSIRPASSLGLRTRAWHAATSARHALWGRPTASLRALPDFLLIGAQRSGTTSLYRYLAQHPGVRWPAFVKSPHWFDANYDRSLAWYRGHFPLALGDRTWQTGEASPYYLFHPFVPERIAATVPDVRMVAVLRDPVDRAWSAYQHETARGYEQLDFSAALDAEEERLQSERGAAPDPTGVGHHHRHHAYVSRGLYAEQLERYFDYFERDQVLILLTGDMKRDPAAAFAQVCDFLGLEHHPPPPVTHHNVRSYEPLDEALRRRLAARFEEPDRQLEALLGRPLDWTTRRSG